MARAWSSTFNDLIGNQVSQLLKGGFSLQVTHVLATYLDFLAPGLCCCLLVRLASSRMGRAEHRGGAGLDWWAALEGRVCVERQEDKS